jgi:hypothetical protein
MSRKEEKKEQLSDILSEINSPKHDLIRLSMQLQEIGAKRKADQLDRVIAALEAMQNSR